MPISAPLYLTGAPHISVLFVPKGRGTRNKNRNMGPIARFLFSVPISGPLFFISQKIGTEKSERWGKRGPINAHKRSIRRLLFPFSPQGHQTRKEKTAAPQCSLPLFCSCLGTGPGAPKRRSLTIKPKGRTINNGPFGFYGAAFRGEKENK